MGYPDSTEEKEWLIVKKGDDDEKVNSNSTYTLEHYVDTTKEIAVLELNDDLRAWMNAHEEQIKGGDWHSISITSELFRENFAQDVTPEEADLMAIVQKPFNQSNFVAKSGPPAWKELPTWYQISDADRMIPPDVQRTFAQNMNATTTTLNLNASHASYVSHPNEIADFILNATKGK